MTVTDSMVRRLRKSLWGTWGRGRQTTDWPSHGQLRTALEAALTPTAAAWGFDGCKRPAGRDHAVVGDADQTLCGRPVNPNGFPTGEPFRPEEPYTCKTCRTALARLES